MAHALLAKILVTATAAALGLASAAPAAANPLDPPLPPTVMHASCPFDYGVQVHGCASAQAGDACPDPAGCIWITTTNRREYSHELGHVWDQQVLTPAWREMFTRMMRYPAPGAEVAHKRYPAGTPWYGDPTARVSPPAEMFADGYANCRIGSRLTDDMDTVYEYYPSARRHRRFCNAIGWIAAATRR